MAGTQILVVDDNDMHSRLVSFLLQEAGHSVRIAESAEVARDVLRSFFPDLILMDLQLPGMDGLELTRVLRLDPLQATTPIVALTAYTDPSDLERARAAGCNGKISKPIDMGTFARQVAQYINPTTVQADAPCDNHDLLAELRNSFLAEGLEQCSRILDDFKSGPGCAVEVIERVMHRWADLAETLGFPEISDQARKMEESLRAANPQYHEIERGVEMARRRFSTAGRRRPKLPVDLINSLNGMRIGLANFSEEQANRIRSVALRANVDVVIEPIKSPMLENGSGFNACIINECGGSSQTARQGLELSVPSIVIHSRASLPALSKLPSRACDFVIAPWDAEEILIRVSRLIGKGAPHHAGADSSDLRKRRIRILIADDDPDIVAMVSETLQQLDMECDVARSGKQTLEAVQRRLPDAIVLDVNMIDLDGFEVLTRLRRNLTTKQIPVLLLTARGLKSDIAQGFELGANDYVVKPFQPLDLAKRVDKMVTDRQQLRLSR
jgi:two-component system cell cycle response regulator DivK